MILVDSSVWIDYFRGLATPQADYLDGLLGVEAVCIGDLILTEVLQGFVQDRDFDRAEAMLATLDVVELGGRDVAVQAATYVRRLRRLRITVRKTIDAVIATRCIRDGLTLLYSDRDFDPFVRHLGLRAALS